ncbi:uncharacterized protein TRAVEDRAFT_71514 [Trametes versicolor FP-101664 SS1]|uniref:uncharacterized protein n=1 Tax=Trametes versicolor (strain FP-101664) TaxID=717944 RepID=UPI0004621491|nr:uncharacterized protein TRAVEDRAFT_71514 [Trametes versicolor FP-101664 SS1]EIW59455.1 hypothetical protein TRAVEDRAFT_71514 [Trametes versicolor FP-101664 SS1]
MKRQRHSPPQRHSSLPPSLHRLLVSGPPQQSQDADDDAEDTALQRGDDGEEIPFGGAADPVNPAPGAEPALPSLVLTQAAFAGLGVVEPIASRRHSRSPAPHAAQVAAGPIPALPLPGPSFPPPRIQEAAPSPRRIPESGRGSPASLTAENYPVAVGSTAYSVTTLSPLRATILPPGVEPASAPAVGPQESASSGVAVSPPAGRELSRTGGERTEVKRSESDTEGEVAAVGEKRARRARSEQRESTASSSSEHAQAPKSKKTLIACHFCRARKLRCDGLRPSCSNCRKRVKVCTYEQQPKRRGPGKTPRATVRRRTRHATATGDEDAEPGRAAEVGVGVASGSGSGVASTGAAAGAPGPEAAGPSNAEGASAAGASLPASAAAAAVQTGPFPMTRQAFEPQLTGPIPTYPGFAYRPPSAHSAGQLPPFHFYSLGRGMSRSVASDSVRSSNTSNVSSAPSVPDSEEGPEGSVADELMELTELEEFYQHPQPRPGPGEDGSQ